MPDFKADNFLRMAEMCRVGGLKFAAAQKDCLSAALQILSSKLPMTDFCLIARVRSMELHCIFL